MNTNALQHKEHLATAFLKTSMPRPILIINAIMALVYFYVITFLFHSGNIVLFGLLVVGEIFHIWQVLTYLYTIWDTQYQAPFDSRFAPTVDVYITVAGEPVELVRETIVAAQHMKYASFQIYILNDGYVAGKENWYEIEALAKELQVNCITRKVPGGAKAGNINHALVHTTGEYVAIFDADHVPHRDFLEKMIGYCADRNVGFVQSPQYYKNYNLNYVTRGAWEQQELFFGPICKGKNRLNAATMCGTNMVIARSALEEVGGMCTESIAEDFVTGLFMHERGWKSVYVPEVLAEGLAPEDFLSYHKQQFRWARGALDVLLYYNPLFRKGLSIKQKIQYLSSASYYASGLVIAMNALLPIVFLFFGITPIHVSTMLLAAVFIPYIFMTLYTIQRSTNYSFTFQSLAFSMSGFAIHIQAFFSALTQKKVAFAITPKRAVRGNFMHLVSIHIAYIAVFVLGTTIAIVRDGITASTINNVAWAFFNVAIFWRFIAAAVPTTKLRSTARTLMPSHYTTRSFEANNI